MKKILTILAFTFVATGIFAQTVKKPVIIKRTATWCPFCGQWGWTFMKDVMDEFDANDNAVVLGMHFSGDLETDVAVDLAGNIGGFGQPRFYINNSDLSVSGGSANTKLGELRDQIATINAQTPDFEINNLFGYKSPDAPEITSSVAIVPNISDFSMDYYAALYLIEDNLMNIQSSQPGIVPHPNVMRASFNGSFGELIFESGSSWDGESVVLEYTLENNEYIGNDYLDLTYDIALVIFSYDGNTYTIEQADIINDISLLSNASELVFDENAKLIQNGNEELSFSATPATSSNAVLNIYDINGRIIMNQNIELVKDQLFNQSINISNLEASSYIFSINSENGIWTKQFVVVR